MYIVKLKNDFYFQFNFHFSILKRKTIGSQTMKIYMTANRLCSKLNIFGVNLYNEITKTRWLQKRGRIFLNSFFSYSIFIMN